MIKALTGFIQRQAPVSRRAAGHMNGKRVAAEEAPDQVQFLAALNECRYSSIGRAADL